jgi:hypothetical protein
VDEYGTVKLPTVEPTLMSPKTWYVTAPVLSSAFPAALTPV